MDTRSKRQLLVLCPSEKYANAKTGRPRKSRCHHWIVGRHRSSKGYPSFAHRSSSPQRGHEWTQEVENLASSRKSHREDTWCEASKLISGITVCRRTVGFLPFVIQKNFCLRQLITYYLTLRRRAFYEIGSSTVCTVEVGQFNLHELSACVR